MSKLSWNQRWTPAQGKRVPARDVLAFKDDPAGNPRVAYARVRQGATAYEVRYIRYSGWWRWVHKTGATCEAYRTEWPWPPVAS